jgi:hypothetical protein
MLPKFFSRGVGKGKGPVLYCTNIVVPAFDPVTRRAIRGEFVTRDPAPVVLRGDPDRTMMLIDSIDRKWKYTSGVIAFTVSDAPTAAEQELVMDDFEATAFAGLEREQYDILWVRHEHEGNVELHFVTPRMELTTQKALNIAPPGYEKTFDAWRDSLNFRFGWADPSAPERAKLVQQGDHHIKTDAARVKAGLERAADPKKDITDWLTARIGAGLVSDRAGVAASLGELGEITRQGKDYISVKPTGSDKAIRLKGVIYEQNFSAAEFSQRLSAATESKDGSRPGRDGYIDESRAGEARRELESRLEGRAQYNRDRYQKADEPAQKELGGELAADRAAEPSPGIAEPEIVASAIPDDSVLLSDHLRRELGPDALPINNDSNELPGDRPAEESAGATRRENLGFGTAPEQPGRALSDHPKEHGNRNWLESWRAASAENFEKLRGFYDGIREKTAVWLRAAWAAISGGYAAAGSAEQCLTAASAGVIESGFALEQASRELDRHADRAVGVLKMKRTDELGTFKKQINLVEYAEANGYEIDKAESSKSSVVMRGPGSDKIIVATAEDGHGVYFSVRDDRDNGTIIDFVQSRKSMNLGEVRMELRPWIGTQRPTAKPVQRKPEAERPRRPDASSADRQAVLASWIRAERAERHPYLESRGIAPATLQDSRFAGVVKIDRAHGNAIFPHYDRQGLSGYELKNQGFTGFSKHGRKALWYSTNAAHCERLVITESAIDALSHAQLRREPGAGYLSIGGQMSPEQVELVQSVLEKAHRREAVLVLATDNDEAGQRLARQVAGLAPQGMVIERDTPQAKDWNDDLQAQAQARQRFDRGLGR